MLTPKSLKIDKAFTSEPALCDVASITEVFAGILKSTVIGSLAHIKNLVKLPGWLAILSLRITTLNNFAASSLAIAA
jgi:hypothetical protein